MSKILFLFFMLLLSSKIYACQIIYESTERISSVSESIHMGYISSVRLLDIEGVTEDSFPLIDYIARSNKLFRVAITETLKGKNLSKSIIEIELGWCSDTIFSMGEKVLVFRRGEKEWDIKHIGVNLNDLKSFLNEKRPNKTFKIGQ